MIRFDRLLPSRRWLFIPPILIGLLTVVSLAISKKELKRVPIQEVAQPLRVVRAMTTDLAPRATGYGTAKPLRVWTAVAEVGGRIVETHPELRSGFYVEAGETLLRIDDQDYILREKQRSADLAQAKAQAEQLVVSQESDHQSLIIQQKLLAVRQADVDRMTRLKNISASSASEADAAQSALLTQEQAVQSLKNALSLYPSRIASAQATIETAESRLAEAFRDIERTRVAAPFAGVLSGVRLEPDQYVMPGERMFEIHDVHSIEIESQFSLSQLSRLIPTVRPSVDSAAPVSRHVHSIHAAGLSAIVTTRSGDMSVRYVGRPVRVREAIDDQTRTLGIVVEVANDLGNRTASLRPDDDNQAGGGTVPIAEPQKMPLRPGTYCEVTLIRKRTVPGIKIPRTAIVDDTVYVVDQDSRLRRRQVRVGFAVGNQIAIVDGLSDGDLVAVKPVASVSDGRLIQPEIVPGANDEPLSSPGNAEPR